jgi:hypothetical protein
VVWQLGVAGYLASVGETNYALALLGLILPQIFFQFKYFLKDPIEYDVKYQVRGWDWWSRAAGKGLSQRNKSWVVSWVA